jgi:hypothetical protein
MRNILFLLPLLCCALAQATEWTTLGPRPMAMGGAGVALPQGAQSAYWNPAALASADNPSGVQFPLGGRLNISGSVIQGAQDLHDINEACQNGDMTVCDQQNIDEAFNAMNDPRNGARGDIGVGAGLKMGRWAFFLNNLTQIGARPRMDTANVDPVNIQDNASALQVSGISLTEFGVGFGYELPFARGVQIGSALKGMSGRVGYHEFAVVSEDPGEGGLDDFDSSSRTSFQLGADVGALWDVSRSFEGAVFKPRVGVSARNINNPKFKNPDAARAAGLPDRYSVQGAVRMGVAISPLKFWNIAADLDLTRNVTTLPGVASRQLGVGTEFNVFNRPWLNIPLRAGLARNVADSGAKTALTAGIGFNFLHVNLDLGISSTPRTQSVSTQGKDEKIPNEFGAGGQIAVLFGGPKS